MTLTPKKYKIEYLPYGSVIFSAENVMALSGLSCRNVTESLTLCLNISPELRLAIRNSSISNEHSDLKSELHSGLSIAQVFVDIVFDFLL